MIYILGGALGVAELVGNVIIHLTINRLQRRFSLIVSYVISIVSCGLFFFFGFSANSTNFNCTEICQGGIQLIQDIFIKRNFNYLASLFNSDF